MRNRALGYRLSGKNLTICRMPASDPNHPTTERRLTPAVWLATGLGVGLVTPAPGTFGALWGLPWAWTLLAGYGGPWAWLSVPVGILLGVPLCTRAARDLGGKKDPGAIVWDEIATVPIVFLPMLLVSTLSATPLWLAIGFGLHRLFDISKPWPCRSLEKLPDGWGIMMDDVVAALYGAVVLAGLLWGYTSWTVQT